MTIRQGTTIISGGGGKVTSVNGEIGDVVVKSVVNEKDNSTQLKFWLGTQEEYEQITEKDASTLYYTSGEDSSAISYDDLTDKPTINTVPLSGDMTLAELGIQGELQAGTGITIEDNVICATVVGGVTSVNGQTGDVTVEGLKDQNTVNTGLLKFWTGTKEQYAEIETKDPNTLYYVGETLTPATLATVATTGLYADLLEKPQINNVELTGNKTLTELGIAATSDLSTIATSGSYTDAEDKPQINTVTLEGNKTSEDLGLQDAETALNYNNITNCITKIPQDIKLELNDGILTLKVGSKVYIPNGAGVFDEVTTSSDATLSQNWGTPNDKLLIFYKPVNNSLERLSVSRCYSGTTDSGSGDISHIFYDTTINKINWIETSGSIGAQLSIPIALVTAVGDNTSSITSIDQIFNGFSYIGSTIFALPGIKGLIPNRFNTDGSLNSEKFTTTSVSTLDNTSSGDKEFAIANTHKLYQIYSKGYIKYLQDKNLNITTVGSIVGLMVAGTFSTDSTGRITSLTPNTTFHAVDYNEFSIIKDNTVLIDTAQDITGSKRFKKWIVRKEDDVESMSSGSTYVVSMWDKNNKSTGGLISYSNSTSALKNTNNNATAIRTEDTITDSTDTKYGEIIVRVFSDGTYYGTYGGGGSQTPPVLTLPNSTEVSSQNSACIPWLGLLNNPTQNTNLVHKTGNETISGTKTFNQIVTPHLIRVNTTIDTKVTDDSEQENALITGNNTDGNVIAQLNTTRTGTYNSARLRCLSSDNRWADLRIRNYDNGNVRVTIDGFTDRNLELPTSQNDYTVPHTKWVKSLFQVVSTLPAEPDPNVFYFIPEE